MKICPQTKKRNLLSGVTLIEVIVGMAVVGITVVSVYAGFSAGFRVLESAREGLRATQIMVEKFETIRLYNWDQVNTPGFIPATFKEYYAYNNTNAPSLIYTGTVKIATAPIDASYSNDLRQVTITVSWKSGGVPQKRELSSLISRYGLQNYVY